MFLDPFALFASLFLNRQSLYILYIQPSYTYDIQLHPTINESYLLIIIYPFSFACHFHIEKIIKYNSNPRCVFVCFIYVNTLKVDFIILKTHVFKFKNFFRVNNLKFRLKPNFLIRFCAIMLDLCKDYNKSFPVPILIDLGQYGFNSLSSCKREKFI